MSSKYFRQLITLTQGGKSGMGKLLLEGRGDTGKAVLSIQDATQGLYKVVLFTQKDGKNLGADIGAVMVAEKGQSHCKLEFDRHNIAHMDFTLEQVRGACVATVHNKSTGNITPLLMGHIGNGFDWSTGIRLTPSHTEPTQNIIEAIEPTSQPEAIKATETMVEEKPPEPQTLKDILSKPRLPTHHHEEVPKGVYATCHFDLEITLDQTCFEEFFHISNRVNIFNDIEGRCWVATSLNHLASLDLPINTKSLLEDSFITTCEGRYRHIALGRGGTDGQYTYTLAIPDIYTGQKDQMLAGRLGNFTPCNDTKDLEDQHGYWLKPL